LHAINPFDEAGFAIQAIDIAVAVANHDRIIAQQRCGGFDGAIGAEFPKRIAGDRVEGIKDVFGVAQINDIFGRGRRRVLHRPPDVLAALFHQSANP
jgi:hypothetical protein